MTNDELLAVTSKLAYEWVKTGHWNYVQFRQWLDAKMEEREQQAWAQRE